MRYPLGHAVADVHPARTDRFRNYKFYAKDNTDTNNWAPRLSLVWQATNRTVISGGGSVFYAGQGSVAADARPIDNWPFNRSAVLQATATRASFLLREGITEGVAVQFRAEVFNVNNTPTLADPNSNFDSPDFGKVRGTVSTPRQMQFALRFSI